MKNLKTIKQNLYYFEQTGERVKIRYIYSSGVCVVVNKAGIYKTTKIGSLKKVY